MTKDKLRTYISIIFNKEKRQLSKMGKTWNLMIKENKTEIVYDHAFTIIDIYANIHTKKELKENFLEIMKNLIKSGDESYMSTKIFVTLNALAFFVLLKLGYKKECFQCLKERNDNNKTSTIIIFLFNRDKSDDLASFVFNRGDGCFFGI